MQGEEATADRYRARAEEVRAIALTVKDLAARHILLRVADDYEKMAQQRDSAAETDRAIEAHKSGQTSN